MNFLDTGHAKQYKEFIEKAAITSTERSWYAALFLLSAPLLARRCGKYIETQKIRFPELIEESSPWSSSEKSLVKLAAALFNNSWKIDINDVFWNLDQNNVSLALEALKIRFS